MYPVGVVEPSLKTFSASLAKITFWPFASAWLLEFRSESVSKIRLLRHYNVPRATVVDVLTEMTRKANIQVCELPRQRVIDALSLCRESGRVNFGDALIWACAAEDDAEVLTFDRRFPADQITVTIL